MPGSKIPKESWLDNIGADKVVHVVMFSILTFLWCAAVIKKTKYVFLMIAAFCLAYGIAMEFVQRDLIANRGFDVWDRLSVWILCKQQQVYKKIDPCGNRGRNQN
jgi:hypothetical protein